jgi:hypothetical protein
LVIARVRLPRHPDVPAAIREEDEAYAMACEVATMEYAARQLPTIPVPRLYAYEGPGSRLVADAGAVYMLLEASVEMRCRMSSSIRVISKQVP